LSVARFEMLCKGGTVFVIKTSHFNRRFQYGSIGVYSSFFGWQSG